MAITTDKGLKLPPSDKICKVLSVFLPKKVTWTILGKELLFEPLMGNV